MSQILANSDIKTKRPLTKKNKSKNTKISNNKRISSFKQNANQKRFSKSKILAERNQKNENIQKKNRLSNYNTTKSSKKINYQRKNTISCNKTDKNSESNNLSYIKNFNSKNISKKPGNETEVLKELKTTRQKLRELETRAKIKERQRSAFQNHKNKRFSYLSLNLSKILGQSQISNKNQIKDFVGFEKLENQKSDKQKSEIQENKEKSAKNFSIENINEYNFKKQEGINRLGSIDKIGFTYCYSNIKNPKSKNVSAKSISGNSIEEIRDPNLLTFAPQKKKEKNNISAGQKTCRSQNTVMSVNLSAMDSQISRNVFEIENTSKVLRTEKEETKGKKNINQNVTEKNEVVTEMSLEDLFETVILNKSNF